MTNKQTATIVELHRLIVQHFDMAEIQLLSFDLNINYDELPGETRTSKVRGLINFVLRTGRIDDLLMILQLERPAASWPELTNISISEVTVPAESSAVSADRTRLRRFLTQSFSELELDDLCFDLGLSYQYLPGANKAVKVLEIITYFERRNRLDELVEYVQRLRPDINLADFTPRTSIVLPEHLEIASVEELQRYLSETGKDSIPLHEAKMLLVGQGGVGKTSLVNQLLGIPFDAYEDKTEGIAINRWPLILDEDITIKLNIWDFGGQEIYHATHQFFFTERSLYLLVLDARQGEQESRLEYWLKLIESFGGNAPVIIVLNKIDQHYIELDQRGLEIKYPNIRAFIDTSCKTGQGIDELRQAVSQAIEGLHHIHDELRSSWYAVKVRLENMERDFIAYDSYIEICEQEGVAEEVDQRVLIRILHDLGVVLNYQEDLRLEDTNVLNPEWVTTGVYQVITSDILSRNHGILRLKDLGRILDPRDYPSRKHPYIVDMMAKFELCLLYPGRKEQYLVPELLPKKEPELGWDRRNSLAFEYHYDILPGSIISRFIVRMKDLIYQSLYWRNGVVVAMEGSKALIRADREGRRIYAWISEVSPGAPNPILRRSLLSVIRAHFREIHNTIARLDVQEVVPLPGHPGQDITYRELQTLEQHNLREHFYARIGAMIDVQQLLNGIEAPQERKLPDLRDKLVDAFSFDDIKDIAFKLDVEYEDFDLETKSEFARELVRHLSRRGRIPDLIVLCEELNAAVAW